MEDLPGVFEVMETGLKLLLLLPFIFPLLSPFPKPVLPLVHAIHQDSWGTLCLVKTLMEVNLLLPKPLSPQQAQRNDPLVSLRVRNSERPSVRGL
ncbi:hypothetical protein CesoFtcFv8_025041 [Champsocephalus esox]|uniref:Uncharacterized protein n=1 Tax=Champsocephalus esox TaxID=159716 RepID=A0AAN8B3Q2_9TELE|nr:hypothetical protein CesoFtcFv8_025041 [Champsocephalus esox]